MTALEFKEVFFVHRQRLYRTAFDLLKSSQDAEDAVQEVYIRLWNRKDELENISNSEAYSVTLVKNISLDMLRSKKRKGDNISLDDIQIAADDLLINEEQSDATTQLRYIKRWLSTLPEMQRHVFICRHQLELDIHSIAERLNLTESNVKVILSRLRKLLKEVMVNYE